jgi:hypothetical protein
VLRRPRERTREKRARRRGGSELQEGSFVQGLGPVMRPPLGADGTLAQLTVSISRSQGTVEVAETKTGRTRLARSATRKPGCRWLIDEKSR